MSAELLHGAIAAFAEAWRDETGRRPSELEPAHADRLAELETALGAPLPASVRVLLERFDGSYVPVSPERPDELMFAAAICMRLSWVRRRDVVPIIECELDPVTGIQRVLAVSVADPWGPLKEDDGDTCADTVTLLEWFAQVTAENRNYVWPARRTITPGRTWLPCAEISEQELAAMPVGAAIATQFPDAKRNRSQLRLRVQLEPGVWAESFARREDDSPSLVELAERAAARMEREILRARSQWVIPIGLISPAYRGGRSERLREHFVGSVEIA